MLDLLTIIVPFVKVVAHVSLPALEHGFPQLLGSDAGQFTIFKLNRCISRPYVADEVVFLNCELVDGTLLLI